MREILKQSEVQHLYKNNNKQTSVCVCVKIKDRMGLTSRLCEKYSEIVLTAQRV